MKYRRIDAKDYARRHLRGIWAAALTPFHTDGSIDEAGLKRNLRHWSEDLAIDGIFVNGKQAEAFSMSLDERKRMAELAVAELDGRAGTIISCSDANYRNVIDLAEHAQSVGADFIVVHAPVLHFFDAHEETIYAYYKSLGERLDIGIALWSHPDAGYLLSPELCARLAELPNIVAIKYSVPRAMYAELTRLAGDKLIVSTASEEAWLDNIIELDWQVYLCSTPPFLLQTKHDRRMREYTDLAFAGKHEEARAVSASLEPVRLALKKTRPPEKPQAHQKYWQELLGQAGGTVRAPLLALSDDEKQAIATAFETCGLARDGKAESSAA